jgi:hypothetical protein
MYGRMVLTNREEIDMFEKRVKDVLVKEWGNNFGQIAIAGDWTQDLDKLEKAWNESFEKDFETFVLDRLQGMKDRDFGSQYGFLFWGWDTTSDVQKSWDSLIKEYGEDEVYAAWDRFADLYQEDMTGVEAVELFEEEIEEILEKF